MGSAELAFMDSQGYQVVLKREPLIIFQMRDDEGYP